MKRTINRLLSLFLSVTILFGTFLIMNNATLVVSAANNEWITNESVGIIGSFNNWVDMDMEMIIKM